MKINCKTILISVGILFISFISGYALAPIVRFSSTNNVADEVTSPGTTRKLEVTLSAASTTTVTVMVKASGGTASLKKDYFFMDNPNATEIQLTWQAGDVQAKTIVYQIVDDTINEGGGEQIVFELSNPIGATLEAATMFSNTWIYDDDFPNAPKLKKATNHEMRYYISTPKGWKLSDNAAVVFAIDGAGRWYRGMDESFRTAREDCPFIVITPITLSNGNYAQSDIGALSEYYPPLVMNAAWIDKYNFDEQGLLAVLDDVKKAYNSQAKFFISGHSGGGLLNYRMIFQHPDLIFASAPACPNFYTSAISNYSTAPERMNLPIKVFQGAADPYLSILNSQWLNAKLALDNHQYTQYSRDTLAAPAGHEPFAKEVMNYFCNIKIISSTSKDEKESIIQFFPNPATDYIEIKPVLKVEEIRIQFFDLYGNLVLQSYNQSRMNVSNLPKGIYLLHYSDNMNRSFYSKLILQ
ncbi:MAG: T9SS type A sorting domain-containing protein [Saprospiraceae bacterium]